MVARGCEKLPQSFVRDEEVFSANLALPKNGGKPSNNWADTRVFGQALLVAVYIVVMVGAIYGIYGTRHASGCRLKVAIFGPVLDSKEVAVVKGAVENEE